MSGWENYNGYDTGLGGGVSQEGYDSFGSDVYQNQAPIEPEDVIDETVPRTVPGGTEQSGGLLDSIANTDFLPISSDIGHENTGDYPSAFAAPTSPYEDYYRANGPSDQSEGCLPTPEYEVVSAIPGYADQNGGRLTASTVPSAVDYQGYPLAAPNFGDIQAASSTSFTGSNTYQYYNPQPDFDLKPQGSLSNQRPTGASNPGEIAEGTYSNSLTSDPSTLQTSDSSTIAAYSEASDQEANIVSTSLEQVAPASALEVPEYRGNIGYYKLQSSSSTSKQHLPKFKKGEKAWYRPGANSGPYVMKITSVQLSSTSNTTWLYDIQHITAGWVHSGISESYLDYYS